MVAMAVAVAVVSVKDGYCPLGGLAPSGTSAVSRRLPNQVGIVYRFGCSGLRKLEGWISR